MYLARIPLNSSRKALFWLSNPYRVHQRLMMAYDGDPRLLFRVEETPAGVQILVQSNKVPDWKTGFGDFDVLASQPEHKYFDPVLREDEYYRFRLLANPTVKKTVEKDGVQKKARVGIVRESDQQAWLERKLASAGASLVSVVISNKSKITGEQKRPEQRNELTFLAVQFDGLMRARDPSKLGETLRRGIGSGKGLGFGLLSLAPSYL